MDRQEIIKKTELFVKETLEKDSTGHDWWHIHRVRNLAKRIALHEGADIFIVELAALLHDIGDYKFFQGDEEAGAVKVREWLSSLEISPSLIDKIVEITSQISFMHTLPDKGKRKDKKNSFHGYADKLRSIRNQNFLSGQLIFKNLFRLNGDFISDKFLTIFFNKQFMGPFGYEDGKRHPLLKFLFFYIVGITGNKFKINITKDGLITLKNAGIFYLYDRIR